MATDTLNTHNPQDLTIPLGGQLWLTGSHVAGSESDSYAVNAASVHVTGGIYACRLTALGAVNLWGAEVGASLVTCRSKRALGLDECHRNGRQVELGEYVISSDENRRSGPAR